MKTDDRAQFKKGFANAVPIFVLYLCVSFSLGIACYNCGISVFQSALMSALNLTSAGEFAAVEIMARHDSYWKIAVSQVVINMRYLLMSAALLIKLKQNEPLKNRALMACGITDEIFGISVLQSGTLNPHYVMGATVISASGWVAGTALGVIMGNILPDILVTSLSMAIYAMFISIVLIPSRKDFLLGGIVIFSMGASFLFTKVFPMIDSGMRCVILTVVISAGAAFLFPYREDEPIQG